MPDSNSPYSNSFKHAAGALAAAAYLNFTGKTTKITWRRNEAVTALESAGKNYIYAVWHCRQVFLIYSHKNTKACALVSQSRDGEYMARLLEKFGMSVVRGSTSKGGTTALLSLMDTVKEGYHPVITPDGPRGPKETVQQGVIFLAQKTGLPIVPIACALSNKIVFNSWDKFQFPLPFGKASIVYGKPINVSETDDSNTKALEIQTELNAITAQAEKLVA